MRDAHFLAGSAARRVELPAASGGDGGRRPERRWVFPGFQAGNRLGSWKTIPGRPAAIRLPALPVELERPAGKMRF